MNFLAPVAVAEVTLSNYKLFFFFLYNVNSFSAKKLYAFLEIFSFRATRDRTV